MLWIGRFEGVPVRHSCYSRHRLAFGLVVLIVATSASCTASQSAPSPSSAGVAETPEACGAALIQGTLVRHPDWGIALEEPNGNVRQVQWPAGIQQDGDSLIDGDGAVVAQVSDAVEIGGGETGDGVWLACPTDSIRLLEPSPTG